MRRRFPARTALFTAVSLPAAAGAILIATLAWNLNSLLSSVRLIDHTDQVIASANYSFRETLDSMAEFRGYLLTGKQEYRKAYEAKKSTLIPRTEELCNLVLDNALKAASCGDLNKLTKQLLGTLNELDTSSGLEKNDPILARAVPILNAIRTGYSEFIAREEGLRGKRVRAADEARGSLWISLFFTLGVVTVLLGWFAGVQLVRVAKHYEQLKATDARRLADLQRTVASLNEEIRQRQRAEEDLHKSNAILSAIYDSSLDFIFAKDRQGRMLSANTATVAFIGKSRDEIIGKTDREFLGENPGALAITENDKRVMESGVPETVEEIPYPNKLNERIFQSTKCPFRDKNGEVVGLIGVSRDITDIKRAQEELKLYSAKLAASNEELARFTSTASHDLREPIRMIVSFLGLLERKNRDKLDPESIEYLGYAKEGARRMTDLIRNLLQYAQIGQTELTKKQVDLNTVVAIALMNLKVAIEESDAKITNDSLPEVMGDSTQLVQLFQNLISNAIRYRRDELRPEIHVAAQPRDRDWLFCVRDNGMGFEMRYAKSVFEQFRRLHEKSRAGTGLGLSICQKIVKLHEGQIWAESAPGKGSSFYFSIGTSAISSAELVDGPARVLSTLGDQEAHAV